MLFLSLTNFCFFVFSPNKKTFSPHATVAVQVYILVQECRSSHDQTGTDREGWGIKKFDINHGNNCTKLLGNSFMDLPLWMAADYLVGSIISQFCHWLDCDQATGAGAMEQCSD